MYNVSESVESENLALYVCLVADNIERPFTATLTPVSGTAIGIILVPSVLGRKIIVIFSLLQQILTSLAQVRPYVLEMVLMYVAVVVLD